MVGVRIGCYLFSLVQVGQHLYRLLLLDTSALAFPVEIVDPQNLDMACVWGINFSDD